MARYIDAEELYRRLYEGWHTNDTEKAKNIQAVIDMVVTPIMAGMPTADVVPKSEVARCKDCIYFQPDFVLQNGERRPYTEEEIKNGKLVTGDVGINCSSRCERFGYWEENRIPVWFNENDYCSYFKKKYTKEGEGKE